MLVYSVRRVHPAHVLINSMVECRLEDAVRSGEAATKAAELAADRRVAKAERQLSRTSDESEAHSNAALHRAEAATQVRPSSGTMHLAQAGGSAPGTDGIGYRPIH